MQYAYDGMGHDLVRKSCLILMIEIFTPDRQSRAASFPKIEIVRASPNRPFPFRPTTNFSSSLLPEPYDTDGKLCVQFYYFSSCSNDSNANYCCCFECRNC